MVAQAINRDATEGTRVNGVPARTDVDQWVFGWEPTPAIVSVWANRNGRAIVWQRLAEGVTARHDEFHPWIYATTLADLAHLGSLLQPASSPAAARAAVTYQLLDGVEPAYRYLLQARPRYGFEAALLRGARQRYGRQFTTLGELSAEYYGVGPVEQYLMATGQVYFRGLDYSDLHRLQFDLETTALDPQAGRIFLVAIRDSQGLDTVLEAATPADEARLITDLCRLIRERDPDVIENHNLHGFDFPFLVERARLLHVPLLLARAPAPATLERYSDPRGLNADGERRMRWSIPGRELIDTLDAVRRYDFSARDLPSHGLKAVARHFGLAAPDRVYLPGAEVYATYQREPEQVRQYAGQDVAEVDGISTRLLGAPFALAGMAPRRYERVASAGPAMGVLEPLLVRAYLHSAAALPKGDTVAGHVHSGGAVHLFATGVAEQVVKADIASLYPSLMRVYSIGPRCDRLQVLLGLVNHLTDLRLQHKAAARTAPGGSVLAAQHLGTQAAMKIVINAAYGYLGAGSMALFADPTAADEVTRRGREVLTQVVRDLRAQGVALLEADTDGVFFAAPAGWSEADERVVVAAVAAGLPAGIQLEYEGRYRAMLSHKVKNYALLGYDGRLIMRGAAFRSSRAEPFGEHFLQAAVACLLQGDVVGLYAVYHNLLAALDARAVPTREVATRVRLRTGSAAYARTRATAPESAAEALLAAGRRDWFHGERVWVYRAAERGLVWLPDADEETRAAPDPRDYDVPHYRRMLFSQYAGRLREAFAPADFDQLFRLEGQHGLFDRPIAEIEPLWIRCAAPIDHAHEIERPSHGPL